VPTVLLHGYADSWRFFEPLLDHLPEDVHAYVHTQRGHGDADRPAHGYGLRGHRARGRVRGAGADRADLAAFARRIGA
jgi:alpha-beta hydrolase superfamily lysophospholipase